MFKVKHFSQGAFFLERKIFFQKEGTLPSWYTYRSQDEKGNFVMLGLRSVGYVIARVGMAKNNLLAVAAAARASEVGRTIECFVVLPVVLVQDGILLAKEKLSGLVPPNPFDLPAGEYEDWGCNNPPDENPDHPIPGEAEASHIQGIVL